MPGTAKRRNFKRRTLRSFMSGGANDEKYILLSCPEFNSVVDTIIANDGPIALDGKPVEVEHMQGLNTDISTLTAANNQYIQFLKEVGLDSRAPAVISDKVNQLHYLRKINNYETKHFYRGYINWNSFPDKTPDIRMNANTTIRLRGAKVIFFAYFTFNETQATTIIDQFLYLNSLTHYGIAELNIVLPYFPVGTAERIVGEGETPAAGPMAHMLNTIPEAGAKNNLYIFDIHALCSRFFFHTNTRPVLMSIMPEYISYIQETHSESAADNWNIIVFPDDGAKKRFDTLLPPNTKKILCSKTRGTGGKQHVIRIDSGMEYLEEGFAKGKQINLFLIDDLVQSGGSVLVALDGIHAICMATPGFDPARIHYMPIVTHSVFPQQEKLDAFFSDRGPEKANITKLITTNSRPIITRAMVEKFGPERVVVFDISKAISTVFTNHMDKTYITPYIIN